ncbi:hypothetical protein ACFT08_15195, partial [Streptomyces rochei]|uniref:hypothetical protein n=1 Tax=Streptomyces rochei TaxID=1928 RepID=UPI0036253324
MVLRVEDAESGARGPGGACELAGPRVRVCVRGRGRAVGLVGDGPNRAGAPAAGTPSARPARVA